MIPSFDSMTRDIDIPADQQRGDKGQKDEFSQIADGFECQAEEHMFLQSHEDRVLQLLC